MRGCDDDVLQWTASTPVSTINYSDDEILHDSTLLADDEVCADGVTAVAARRKSADYACCDRAGVCFAPYTRLDVEHHPLNGRQHVDERQQNDCRRLATQRSCDDDRLPRDVSAHFGPRTTTAVHDCERTHSIPATTAAAWSRDSVHHGNDDVTWWDGDTATADYRLQFITSEQPLPPADDERRALSSRTTGRLRSTPCVLSVSDQTEFIVRQHDTDLSSTTSSSSSSPAARLAPQSSPAAVVADIIPAASQRLPPTSLRARKREQVARSAAGCRLRRSNSLAGSSAAGRSLQSADEGFADSRTRTPEPRRMSGSVQNEVCCACRRQVDSHRTTGSQSNVSTMSTMSDQARKRSYRVGLNLFNKYVVTSSYIIVTCPSFIVHTHRMPLSVVSYL